MTQSHCIIVRFGFTHSRFLPVPKDRYALHSAQNGTLCLFHVVHTKKFQFASSFSGVRTPDRTMSNPAQRPRQHMISVPSYHAFAWRVAAHHCCTPSCALRLLFRLVLSPGGRDSAPTGWVKPRFSPTKTSIFSSFGSAERHLIPESDGLCACQREPPELQTLATSAHRLLPTPHGLRAAPRRPTSLSTLSVHAAATMPGKSDRFGAVELSPRRDEPLIHPGSASLDELAAPSVSITLCVMSATELRPMRKGFTSNPMCEIALLLGDGSGEAMQQPAWGATGDVKTDHKLMMENRSSSGSAIAHGVTTKTFRTKVVRSSLNPIWNMDVDFGDYNVESVLGVLLIVRHIEKMGLVKKDIGQVFIPIRELLELKSQPSREQTYTLEATGETNAREAHDGLSNRKYGKITIRFNSYGLTQSAPTLPNYTGLMTEKQEMRPTSLSEGSVTHEDEFSGENKRSSPSRDIQAEVKKLQSFHQSKPVPGEVWYAVSSQWITNWLLFVSKHRGKVQYSPGEIDNMPLISDDLRDGRFEVRRGLVIKKDFRMINKPSWDYYVAQYGGGPAIEVPVPADCPNTATWLASLRLDSAARVGTGYCSSDSE